MPPVIEMKDKSILEDEPVYQVVFIDAEFKNFNPGEPGLISLAFVSVGGESFYAESVEGAQGSNCSDFVKNTVLPLLEGGACRMEDSLLAAKAAEFLRCMGKKVVIVGDSEWDERVLSILFYDHPQDLPEIAFRIPSLKRQDRQEAYLIAEERFWSKETNNSRRHHALVDAHCLRLACLAAHEEWAEWPV